MRKKWKESTERDPQKYLTEFQTNPEMAKFMASLVPDGCKRILEPTPGIGNIVRELEKKGYQVDAPADYFSHPRTRYDCIVMNPPFSRKFAFNVPDDLGKVGMQLGYHILYECMQMTDNVIALMPWFTVSDSDKRLAEIKRYGLRRLIALPRRTFQHARIQTVILVLEKGFKGDTVFDAYTCLNDHIVTQIEFTP